MGHLLSIAAASSGTVRRLVLFVAGCALLLPGAVEAQGHAPSAPVNFGPAIARLVAAIEASPDTCKPARIDSESYRTIQADVERFRTLVPAAAGVPIEVMECFWDGMVLKGQRIVISTQLARATPAQRFFMIAHELGHLHHQHHGVFAAYAQRLLREAGSEAAAQRRLHGEPLQALSRVNEAQADDFAIQLMLDVGEDALEAALFWEHVGRTTRQPSTMHPPPEVRAATIRAMAARRARAAEQARLANDATGVTMQ